MQENTNNRLGTALRDLIDDPHGAYQRWRRQETPYHEMCRAVVLAYFDREAATTVSGCQGTIHPRPTG